MGAFGWGVVACWGNLLAGLAIIRTLTRGNASAAPSTTAGWLMAGLLWPVYLLYVLGR